MFMVAQELLTTSNCWQPLGFSGDGARQAGSGAQAVITGRQRSPQPCPGPIPARRSPREVFAPGEPVLGPHRSSSPVPAVGLRLCLPAVKCHTRARAAVPQRKRACV